MLSLTELDTLLGDAPVAASRASRWARKQQQCDRYIPVQEDGVEHTEHSQAAWYTFGFFFFFSMFI